jgi:hypothetical protein
MFIQYNKAVSAGNYGNSFKVIKIYASGFIWKFHFILILGVGIFFYILCNFIMSF